MIFSVIIPAYNEAEFLPNTINKLVEVISYLNIEKSDWEIIVCDNNSSDNTAEIASQKGAKVVFEPENQISKARNKGASIAKGEWLLFVDADTYPTKALMLEVFEHMQKKQLIGCGVTVSVQGGSNYNKLRMERLNPIFRLLKISGGAFLLSTKSGFDKVNGFSDGLYAYEEFDFIYRLKSYGKTIGKKFDVLYQNPVITSGRKGELNLMAFLSMTLSNFFAIVLFILYYILPIKTSQSMGKALLKYWYQR